jgi:hypothetical protein
MGNVEQKTCIEDESMPQKNCEARDEMNLAEFPLCALAHRLKPEIKTLRFEDRIWDKGRNQLITRQLTITGSDAYGLPTEKDDEVLLGLIQLTRARGFTERKVPFTRHELIRILGWRDDSKSYARIEESLNRWTGVTLYYDNAWWNKDRKCWVSPKFHILDNVWLCHRGEPAPDTGLPATGAPQSAFVWNEVVFRSFTHGNLKSIDFEFFKSLKSAIAKRLYRFLDKHFYKRNRFEMDLRELCCEHIGLSRSYDTANLKRKLLRGVSELEAKGFLQRLTKEEQFSKVRRGQWCVAFACALNQPRTQTVAQTSGNDALAQALVQRGVTAAAAQRAVEAFPAERIHANMEVFDWLVQRKDNKVTRNPAGFLMSSITHNYEPPRGFAPSASERPKFTRNQGANRVAKTQQAKAEEQNAKLRSQAVAQFWNSLSEAERQQAEAQAIVEANNLQVELLKGGGAFAETARKAILEGYVLRRLRLRAPPFTA